MSANPKLIQMLDLTDRVMKSWWTIVLGASIGLFGATQALRLLPKTYQAETTIFVAPSQLSQEFVKNNAPDDISMRVASIREAVLSRPYLERLVTEVYGRDLPVASQEKLIESIRANLETEVLRFDPQRGAGVFALSFRDGNPQRAANVVNMLAGLFIEENVKSRTAQAQTTTEVLESLANETARLLEIREREIAEYKAAHPYQLGAQLEANLRLLEGRQRDLENNQRAQAQAENQRQYLVAQKAATAATRASTPVEGPAVSAMETPQARLARLNAELRGLLQRYTPKHPAVLAKQRQIADEEAAQAAGTSAPQSTAPETPRIVEPTREPIDAQIEGAEREMGRLREEEKKIKNEIGLYQQRIESTPLIDQKLAELMKGFDVLKEKSREYQSKVENARGSQKVEQVRQGEQFQVMERATPPSKPIKPNPIMVFAVSIVVGIALLVGPVIARAMLVPTVHSRAALRESSPYPVLIAIGDLKTPETRRRLRSKVVGVALAMFASGGLVAASVATFLH